jgi:hypothetical protein
MKPTEQDQTAFEKYKRDNPEQIAELEAAFDRTLTRIIRAHSDSDRIAIVRGVQLTADELPSPDLTICETVQDWCERGRLQ